MAEHFQIWVIIKLPNSLQSSKGKGKTHISKQTDKISRKPEKLEKPQWPSLGTGFSKEILCCFRFYGAKTPAFITVKRFRLSL